MVNLQIQTTTVCNARCTMCPHADSPLRDLHRVMTASVFEKVVEATRHLQCGELILYMQAEPFTDPDICERMGIAARAYQFRFLELSTNCSLLTPELAEDLMAAVGPKQQIHLEFSLHGYDIESLWNRTALSFGDCFGRLKDFLAVTDRAPNIRRRIVSIETQDNMEPVLGRLRQGLDRELFFRTFASRVHNRAGSVGRPAVQPFPRVLTCPRLREWLYVNYEGKVVLCCSDYKQHEIGNLLCEKPEDIRRRIPQVVKVFGGQLPCLKCDMRTS